jgi:hypothetical protein
MEFLLGRYEVAAKLSSDAQEVLIDVRRPPIPCIEVARSPSIVVVIVGLEVLRQAA